MKKKILLSSLFGILGHFAFCQITNYSQFIGKKISITFPTRLNEPYFYDYSQDSAEPLRISIVPDTLKNHNTAEGIIVNTEKQKFVSDTTKRNLEFLSKLNFNYQGKEIKIIKLS